MKNAIVALTRGYPGEKSKYDTLIKRNNSIYLHFNKLRKFPAEIILFHEGNISSEDQDYIIDNSPEKIIFRSVSEYFGDTNLKLKDAERFSLGYRQMCRFHMFHIWKEVADYDYILRVDEDIEITKFNPLIFEYMNINNINFMTGKFAKETHKLTNETLYKYLSEGIFENELNNIYNQKFPYTNCYATNINFWKNTDVYNKLKKIALSDEQIINRWGDLVVLGVLLNYKNEKIKLFKKSQYSHFSHNSRVKNTFLRNLTLNSRA